MHQTFHTLFQRPGASHRSSKEGEIAFGVHVYIYIITMDFNITHGLMRFPVIRSLQDRWCVAPWPRLLICDPCGIDRVLHHGRGY